MNDLESYFVNNSGRQIFKWHHYFEIYDRHFQRFRGKKIVVVEIGVFQGGSLQMWKNYFGTEARIYGVDINPQVKELTEENIEIIVGSQSDRSFLRKLRAELPPIDILIDDGGHKMKQQIFTFQELFDKIKPDGVYVCEDLATSYQLGYGGGYKRRGTFIQFSKDLIDRLNAFHSEQNSFRVDGLTRSMDSLHFYDNVLVIEKRSRERPIATKTGTPVFAEGLSLPSKGIAYQLLFLVNKILQFFRLPSFKLNK
ncbi:MAG: class I SAM-dependent methyltransferase [Bacteroidetes bacterium]|nr:class I SAM-dependent methyltransferase [Bacteroidota bacterium]